MVRVAQVPGVPGGTPQEVVTGGLVLHLRRDALPPASLLYLKWRRPEGGNSIQWVDLVPRPLPFGGVAWWFKCSCGCRAFAVYLNDAGDTWGCRSCLRLVYPSQLVRYPAPGLPEG